MANFTVTISTTQARDKGIARELARVNDVRARQVPPAKTLTTAELIQLIVDDRVDDLARDYKQDLRQRVSDAVDTATAANVTRVAQILGVTE